MCNAAVIVCSSLTACYCTGKMLAQARALKTLQICVFTLPPFKFACVVGAHFSFILLLD